MCSNVSFVNDQPYNYINSYCKKQQLQLLYPGRYMEPNFHYTRDNIPNEHPERLKYYKNKDYALQKLSKEDMNTMERHLGGYDKVISDPSVAPESVIENVIFKH